MWENKKNWLPLGSNPGAQGETQSALPMRYSCVFVSSRLQSYLNCPPKRDQMNRPAGRPIETPTLVASPPP